MKKIIIVILALFLVNSAMAQGKYFTKSGKITFDATTKESPEKVQAVTKTAVAVLDAASGNIQFSVLMRGFQFEHALMEEHFHENYVESTKYPKATFKGQLEGVSALAKDGTYELPVKGQLSLHGASRDIQTKVKVVVSGTNMNATATFMAPLADYNIAIPGLVADKLAKTASVKVECLLQPLKN
ncbi:YceI family protein [Daejeonella sp. H1SJ63]|jgi:polyisoprenoid-binding protein YceI|uniref:YceI family protein n=1 Tax=Daejeonella sp. H1SJ63 TaxID=3034145 RepID=UPI0023EA9181|nr:YceI family protein [Daejeonella sp. H1SJ63]